MKLQCISILFILLIMMVFELVIYLLYLIIKALRTYIDRNSKTNSEKLTIVRTRKPVKGLVIVAVCNVLIIAAIIASIYIQKNHDIYYTENVIIFQSESDVNYFSEMLDETDLNYEVLDGTRVKMQNRSDFLEAVDIVKESSINFSTITIEE